MSLAVVERREVFPATKRGLPDNEAGEPGMGKQETTMSIGHATPKYGKYGLGRASMENFDRQDLLGQNERVVSLGKVSQHN